MHFKKAVSASNKYYVLIIASILWSGVCLSNTPEAKRTLLGSEQLHELCKGVSSFLEGEYECSKLAECVDLLDALKEWALMSKEERLALRELGAFHIELNVKYHTKSLLKRKDLSIKERQEIFVEVSRHLKNRLVKLEEIGYQD